MSAQKGKGTWDFPPKCMLQGRRLKWERLGPSLTHEAAWPTALPREEMGMAPQAMHAACTAQLPLLLPPSMPKDAMHLLCQGYSPKPGGPRFRTVRLCPLLQAAKWGPATTAGGTEPCFQRGCWGVNWAWGALNTPRCSASGYWATHSPQCKGCCYFGFINDWAEGCFSKELYPNHLQWEGAVNKISTICKFPLWDT